MKKIILILVVCFGASVASAQDLKKDTFVAKGDLIEATLYHDNGQIAQTGFYTKTNKLQGDWKSYDANGNQLSAAHYENGKKVGTWLFYQGENMKEVTYDKENIAQVRTWEIKDTRVVSNNP